MKPILEHTASEKGQILTLFALFLAVMVLIVMTVTDVGMFFETRQNAQKTADAAALAGAQELPDDPDAARTVALQYVEANGLDPDDVTISFRCTADVQAICKVGDGRYDTIVVTPRTQSPSFFGGILNVFGFDNCWIDGCHVTARAAGCRGSCGPIGTGPVDVMMVLDHSYSMSTTDLSNAKSAINEMFTNFDNRYHRVGLAVTPPVNVSPGDMCDSINSWSETPNWMPASLTDTFQSSPHVLNSSSPPVNYTTCMDRTNWFGGELTDWPVCSCHTNVGSPIKAAADEIAANARLTDDDGNPVTWGMIVLTDGAANVAPSSTISASTGQNFCTAQAAVTSGSGGNNGYQTTPGNLCADGGGYGEDSNSGTSTSTSCTSTGKDRHRFSNFNLDSEITSGSTIAGIEVAIDAWMTTTSGIRGMCAELSWDGGTSWTSAKSFTFQNTTSERTYTLGGSSDTWGRTWSTSDLSNSNFRVRVTNVTDSTSRTFRMDAISVEVTYSYSDGANANLGPCDWASKQATAAKALGIEVFVIAFGAGDYCINQGESSSSPFYNMSAVNFLRTLATDDSHFYNEPKSTDLSEIFQAIGSQLTSGSRLVE